MSNFYAHPVSGDGRGAIVIGFMSESARLITLTLEEHVEKSQRLNDSFNKINHCRARLTDAIEIDLAFIKRNGAWEWQRISSDLQRLVETINRFLAEENT